ncbi:MAG TPA: hypothetical protein VFA26_09245, partial [Gemmataceae bacterium]|nr:hypothetical protein [Gemmataceae bacterium]
MPRPLDPFEPWRPPPEPARPPDPPVPEVNPFQPWRPPGYESAQPKEPPQQEARDRPPPQVQPRRQRPASPPAALLRGDQKLLLGLLPVFALAWVIAYAYLPAGHGLRLFAVLLPLALSTAAG